MPAFYRILPALVLASALTPFAANARSGDAPAQNAAAQYLVTPAAAPGAGFSQGRFTQPDAAGQVITDKAPAFAAPDQTAAEASFIG